MNHLFNILLAGVLVLSGSIAAQSQPPDTLWARTFGGSEYDDGWSVLETQDGGFVFVGHTHSFGAGSYDVYLVETDASGGEEWSRTFGGSAYDEGLSVQQTQDGGYIIAGGTDSYGAGSYDVYLIKTDGSGNEEWSRTFGGNSGDFGYCVKQTQDGGYIITGYTFSFSAGASDVYLIKTDESGSELWSRYIGTGDDERGYSVQQTQDGGYIISGWVFYIGAGFYNIYLIKTDESGNEVWSRTLGGSGDEKGYSVQQTPNGGYIIGGNTTTYGQGEADFYLVRTDSTGNIIWDQTYGGSSYEYSHGLDQTQDGGYVLAGYTASYGAGETDFYVVKTDESGNELWSQTFGGSTWDEGYGVQETGDSGYIVVGRTYSFGSGGYDAYLIRLQGPQVTITLTPYNPPIVLPASGGDFDFNIEVENTQPSAVNCDVWCDVTLPNGTIFGPVLGPVNIDLPGNTAVNRDRSQVVPANAPAGEYNYNAYIGDYPDAVWDGDAFPFEKSGSGDLGRFSGWFNEGEPFEDCKGAARKGAYAPCFAPTEFTSLSIHPNPFNALTTIRFVLPEACRVTLEVFDIHGCRVGVGLGSPFGAPTRQYPAGTHDIPFDGSNLASGIYVYRLEAGDVTASGKMVLLK